MRLGDHDRTVITAVSPTAHAMSGIHQQHDPVDVKSLGDAIQFAAHQCARAESVRGKETVVRRASMPRGPCVISHARPTGQCSTDLWIASRSANSTPPSPDSPKSEQGKCVDGNASISCVPARSTPRSPEPCASTSCASASGPPRSCSDAPDRDAGRSTHRPVQDAGDKLRCFSRSPAAVPAIVLRMGDPCRRVCVVQRRWIHHVARKAKINIIICTTAA
jgi:hypothetical protein